MHDKLARCLAATILASALFAGLGCAKFNLFYNAEAAFSQAEQIGEEIDVRNQPTAAQKGKYLRCIRKCKLVIEEYPNSAYIDDALFLMGKSHYRLKEWGDALTQFDNLLANFPNSSYVEETMYLKSLALISRGEEESGLEWFARLQESYPKGKFGTEALYRLGDAYAARERYDDAIHYYRAFLEAHPDHESSSQVIAALGRVYYDSGEFEDAAAVLATVDRGRITRAEYFEAEWLRLSSLNRLGRPDEAAEELPELEKAAELREERGRMMLLSGRIQLAQGREEDGLFTLESIAKEFDTDAVAGDATRAMVEYLLRVEGPTGERVRSQLQAVSTIRFKGRSSDRLRSRSRQLQRFDQYMEAFEDADSNAAVEAFRVAESLFTDFARPESALEYYQRVLDDDPQGPLAPRAMYARAFILQNELGDSTAADSTFALLSEEYPDSPQARSLAGELFLEAQVSTVASGPTQPGRGAGDIARDPRIAGAPARRARLDASWPLRRGGPGAAQGRDR